MSPASGIRFLNRLARLYGLQTVYYDINKQRVTASPEALLAMLRSLGAPVVYPKDAPPAWREKRQEIWQRPLEPVSIAWEDESPRIGLRLPAETANARLTCHLKLENGGEHDWTQCMADMPEEKTADVEGKSYAVKYLPLGRELPQGYHRLRLELSGRPEESIIISAPRLAYRPSMHDAEHYWGTFLPLYALHTEKSWGGGDFSNLEKLIDWVNGLGGQVVATLPLLANFWDSPDEISPYLPISRLFWNELYLDVKKIPELKDCLPARAILESLSFQSEIDTLHKLPLVDYRRLMTSKRRILQELCRSLFSHESGRLAELRSFINENPTVEDYARFRATCEQSHNHWRSWPQPLIDGVLREGDYKEEDWRYHVYVQWLAQQQIDSIWQRAQENSVRLYLDLPQGVCPDGYDVWRERDVFVPDTSTGAPPDSVFCRGQNWGFSPIHPKGIREQAYSYIITYLRHHLRYANVLRIDHVMGLHRLYCIPSGMGADRGVYLRYRADEMYAILAVESQRHKAIIVGEDLGTVPFYVRPAMKEHSLQRMYVLQYELASDRRQGLPPIPKDSVASLNTHDMHPFASFWQGLDIKDRQQLNLLDSREARGEEKTRRKVKNTLVGYLQRTGWLKKPDGGTFPMLRACLYFLAASRARILLVNLEDLWLETKPQNVPSTGNENPNWRRKAYYSLEEFCRMPRVIDTLRNINQLRRRSGKSHGREKGSR